MKKIEVAAAVLHKNGTFLGTQRGYGEFDGGWEFPGGKIEEGESPQAALLRELKEKLGIDAIVEQFLMTVECNYPQFHLMMHCYLCSIAEGKIQLKEHKSARWMNREQFDDVEWLPADLDVVKRIRDMDIDGLA